MRTAAFIAASSFAFANLVAAVPVNNKRDIVYSTTTEEVWETQWTTTTVWIDPTGTFTASTPSGGFFEDPSSTYSHSAPILPSTTSVVAASIPIISQVAASAPAPSSTTSVYVAPPAPTTPTSTYVAPAPSSTTTTQAPVAAAPASSAAPAATPVAASSSSGTTGANTGDMTYYDVSVGTGSCGTVGSNADDLVAMNHIDMNNGINPNANPHCGQKINIYYNGQVQQGTVMDTCPGCNKGDLDVTNTLFYKVDPSGNGRVHGVTWSWV